MSDKQDRFKAFEEALRNIDDKDSNKVRDLKNIYIGQDEGDYEEYKKEGTIDDVVVDKQYDDWQSYEKRPSTLRKQAVKSLLSRIK